MDAPNTVPARTRQIRWLPLLVVATLALVPLADLLLPHFGIKPEGRRYATPALAFDLRDVYAGTAGEQIEDWFQARSFIRHGIGARYNEAMFALTGRVPGVTAGKAGWLFVQDQTVELEPATVTLRLREDLDFIAGVKARFAALGVPLYVTLIPDRSRLHADKWAGPAGLPPQRRDFLPAVEAGIRAQGIPVLNLERALAHEIAQGRETHFAEDHHWNYHGAEVAAEASARWLRASLPALASPPVRDNPASAGIQPGSPNRSLVGLLKFRKGSATERPFLRPQEVVKFKTSWRDLMPGPDPAAGLVLETSFGMFGFPQYLEQALGARIDAVVTPGNGAAFPVARALADPGIVRHPYGFVLWEIPEYHLIEGLASQGLGEPIRLPDPGSATGRTLQPATLDLDGLQGDAGTLRLAGREARVTLHFSQPVVGVRVRFRCDGGSKRGQIWSPASGPGGLLVLPGTPGAIDYDFKFADAQREVVIKLRFRDPGFSLADWQLLGLLSQ